jgi:MipA family protein
MATHGSGWRQTLALGLGICGYCASVSRAADQPLWEFGLGAGAITFPDYRGSDSARIYLLPVPYFVYRGKLFKADRDGMRGLLIRNPRAELNVSVDATTPVNSRDNSARAGMPDLKSIIEIGPSLDVHLWRSHNERLRLDLRIPARMAFTIERQPHSVGWSVAPRINLDLRDVAGHAGWDVGMFIGPLYADRQYHDYFYTVAPSFATPGRPAYQAPGGYAGTELLLATSRRYRDFWFGAFVRYDSLAGASFVASPLVRSRSYWAGGFGIARMISRSQRQVSGDN